MTFYIKLRPRIGQHRLEMDLKGPDRYLADEIKILIRASQESEVTDVMIMDCLHLFTVIRWQSFRLHLLIQSKEKEKEGKIISQSSKLFQNFFVYTVLLAAC